MFLDRYFSLPLSISLCLVPFISSIFILLHCVCCYAVIFKSVKCQVYQCWCYFNTLPHIIWWYVWLFCAIAAIPSISDQTHSKEVSENAFAFIFTYIHIRDYVDCVWQTPFPQLDSHSHSTAQHNTYSFQLYCLSWFVMGIVTHFRKCLGVTQPQPHSQTHTHTHRKTQNNKQRVSTKVRL